MVANPNIVKTKIKAWFGTEISKSNKSLVIPTWLTLTPLIVLIQSMAKSSCQISVLKFFKFKSQAFSMMPKNLSKWERIFHVTLVQPMWVNMMTSPDFGRSIKAMTRALTFVSDTSSIESVPTIKHGNEQAHTFGLGAMGLHLSCPKSHSLRKSRIYRVHKHLLYAAQLLDLVESNQIARERKQTFVDLKSQNTRTEVTLINTSQVTLYQNWLLLANFASTLFLVAKIGLSFAMLWWLMDSTTKIVLPLLQWFDFIHQRCLSIASSHYATYRRTSRKKIGRFITQQLGCLRYNSLLHICLRHGYARSSMFAAATEHVDQGLSLTLFLRSDIPWLYEWKTKQTNHSWPFYLTSLCF